MKYIDLIEKLTEEDKKTITAYINCYGCSANFIGVDKWLEQWSHSNQKLYRLLGNSFIKEFPFKYEKTEDEKYREMTSFILNSDFKRNYANFYYEVVRSLKGCDELEINEEQRRFFNKLMNTEHFINNKIDFSIKYKKPNATKILQIQAGAKPLKAIYRVIEYFKDDYAWDINAFEEFKKKFGILYSDNVVIGRACISIHPMDYITMSDNNSNWGSCMSWIDNGCYHVGTIEMMNSNNVLCCYLTNESSPFEFEDRDTGEIKGAWNNKKWRKLFYFNKDIIMGGKAYPYNSKPLTIAILDEIKKLAKENFGYEYQFGPELYQDMTHVTTLNRVANQKMWAKSKSTKKHNIIWDTKGMYNDMLNDEDYGYWCYRNKVAHTKVISVSGKANCLCCNGSIITETDDNYDNEYNDRYDNVGAAICESCGDKYFTCDFCDCKRYTSKMAVLKDGRKICNQCMEDYRICPCCGKIFNTRYLKSIPFYHNPSFYNFVDSIHEDKLKMDILKEDIALERLSVYARYYWDKESAERAEAKSFDKDDCRGIEIEKLACCNDCKDIIAAIFEPHSYYVGDYLYTWASDKRIFLVDPKWVKPYQISNLKAPELKDFNTLAVVD